VRGQARCTLGATQGYSVYGNWTFGVGITMTRRVETRLFLAATPKSLPAQAKRFHGALFIVNSYGGTVELADALNIGSNTLTVTNGTFDTKGYNVTASLCRPATATCARLSWVPAR
jgi:hypothetical protein